MERANFISYCGRDIYYDYVSSTSTGNNSPILLLGGVLQNRKSWEGYVKDIHPHCPIITIDLPGIGDGGILDASVGFDFLADCIHALAVHLNIPKLHIFSTSYSSIVAYEFSARYTAFVDKLVISSSMASLPASQRQVMYMCIQALQNNDLHFFYNTFIDGVCHAGAEVRNRDLSRKVIQKLIGSLTKLEITQFIENTKRVLLYRVPESIPSKIALSPLIFTGAYDTFTPPELCRNIGELYTQNHFGIIDGYDHLFHIGNRQMIISSILPFLLKGQIPPFATTTTTHEITVHAG